MCDACHAPATDLRDAPGGAPLTRRDLLRRAAAVGSAGLAGGVLLSPSPARAAVSPDPRYLTRTPTIRPRSDWAGTSCPVKGTIGYEKTGNVKYLLCHHSASTNSYAAGEVPTILRSFYRMHVDKGWPDIAYNFLVDRYGRIWEGRYNSKRYPSIPSATGGSQGYDQIVCWIGNHSDSGPTAQALASMISVLAWLGDRYHVDTRPGAKTSFVSRGSNRWPKGTTVTTRTIEGHRYMSQTVCPGNAGYAYVPKSIPTEVTRLRSS